MCYTYIIYSKKVDKYYIGSCRTSVEVRINKHNNTHYGTKSYTAIANDWKLVLSFDCSEYSHALRLEKKIKSMKSRIYIANLLKYPEMRSKILEETRKI